jgi:geranylgeranyl diphosphate synthase type I
LKSELIGSITRAVENAWADSGAWDDFIESMRQILSLADTGEYSAALSRWLPLPGLCCRAAGGDASLTLDIAAAWACLQAAAHAMDKVEDGDPLDGWLQGLEAGEVINAANGLVFTASLLLQDLYRDDRTRPAAGEICADFHRSTLLMASGQHRDLASEVPDLDLWMEIAGAKSGAFFRLACRSGARLGTGERARVEAFGEYGYHIGVLLQLRDDLVDMRPALIEGKSPADLRRSLAVAYAFDVLPEPQREQLSAAIQDLEAQPAASTRLIELLDQSGAGLYLRMEIQRLRHSGLEALKKASPAGPAGDALADLLNELSEIQ